MSESKNVTYTLPVKLIEKMREYAKDKRIASINAGVREALEIYVAQVEQEKFKKAMEEASKDPMFIKDMEKVMVDFEKIDSESEKEVPEW